MMAFQFLKGAYKKDMGTQGIFTRICADRIQKNDFKPRVGLDWMLKKKCFTVKVIWHWYRLPKGVMDAPTLAVFKVMFDGTWSNLV